LSVVVLVSALISGVTALLVYLLMRGQVSILKANIGQLASNQLPQIMSRIDEITRYSDVGRLREEFLAFGQDIGNRIESLKRLSTEELARVREDIMTLAERRSIDAAVNHVKQVSITREEFERLREIVAKMGGREEAAERLELLSRIFESREIRVLTWQCKLIHLLEGGLSPEAEADTILSAGIPLSSAKDFLKNLQKHEIVAAKRVESFWLNPEYTWLITYTDEPDWLSRQLEERVKEEREYQDYVRDHISLVEDGLLVVTEQYELPSGRVDIFARDRNGKDVCLELKYPIATGAVVGQLLKYREDCRLKSGQDPRCILVAPKILDKVRQLLDQNRMEHRELLF